MGRSEPIEDCFEELGVYQPVSICALGFRSSKSRRLKGVMVVSNFHPGPFGSIGSSILPLLIQRALEGKLGVTAAVPHGVSGHGLNLVSQKENRKVIQEVLSLVNFNDFLKEASPFIRFGHDSAESSCQVFGDCALVTATLSPKTMEDIPLVVVVPTILCLTL